MAYRVAMKDEISSLDRVFKGWTCRKIATAVGAILLLGALFTVLALKPSLRSKEIVLSVWQLPVFVVAVAILGKVGLKIRDSSFICVDNRLFKEFEADLQKVHERHEMRESIQCQQSTETVDAEEIAKLETTVLSEDLRLAVKIEWRRLQIRLVGSDLYRGGHLYPRFKSIGPRESAIVFPYLYQYLAHDEEGSLLSNPRLATAFDKAQKEFIDSNILKTHLTPELHVLFSNIQLEYASATLEEKALYSRIFPTLFKAAASSVNQPLEATDVKELSSVMKKELYGDPQSILRKRVALVALALFVGIMAIIVWKSSTAKEWLTKEFSVQMGYLPFALIGIALLGYGIVWKRDRALLARIDDTFRIKYKEMSQEADPAKAFALFLDIFEDYLKIDDRFSDEPSQEAYLQLLYRNYLIYSRPIPDSVAQNFHLLLQGEEEIGRGSKMINQYGRQNVESTFHVISNMDWETLMPKIIEAAPVNNGDGGSSTTTLQMTSNDV